MLKSVKRTVDWVVWSKTSVMVEERLGHEKIDRVSEGLGFRFEDATFSVRCEVGAAGADLIRGTNWMQNEA